VVFWKKKKGKDKDKEKKSSLPQPPEEKPEPPFELAGAKLLGLVLPAISGPKRNVHLETAITLLSALAGFATQMAIREKFIATGRHTEEDLFRYVKTKNGDTYYLSMSYADALYNLRKRRACAYKTVMAAAQETGGTEFPGNESFALLDSHVKGTFGKGSFGVPRLPEKHMPRHAPIDLLRDSWDTVEVCLKLIDEGEPLNWPYIIAQSLRLLILKSKGAVDPNLITPLFLESSMPMSYVNPALICGQAGKGGALAADFSRTGEAVAMQDTEFRKALAMTRAEMEGKRAGDKTEKKRIH